MYKYTLRELINILNEATKAYDEGHPIMSDKEWDELYYELVKREEIDGIIYPDSPTQKIIFKVVTGLNKVKHNHLMLSLNKTKDVKELISFINKPDYKDTNGWCGMFKLDGLTCSLKYINGELISAETRGNGIEGEDITHNALIIHNIPKIIPYKDELIVDGEIICDYQSFENFKNDYANPRNFAAGSIRQLSSAEAASRHLSFVAWDLIKGYDDIDFFFWRLEKLDELGFDTVPRVGDAETVEDAIKILDEMREEYPYSVCPIDGYVFRFESQKYYENCGRTEHHFSGALAYKFYDEEYETELLDIEWSLGRTGVLTPVAILKPIEMDGSIVSRASLHNVSVLRDILHTPYIGQKVKVIKSNMIIPQITWADNDWTIDKPILLETISCPVCGKKTKLVKSESGVLNLVCNNPECEGQLLTRVDHFASKKGLDIKGLSRKTIEKLIEWGWINKLFDIYTLRVYQKEWINKPGFGQASVLKILDAIDNSKKDVDLVSFISALGIPLVGKTIAKEIVKYYDTWEDFRSAVGGDWTEFYGFGDEISKAINSFDYHEADDIAKLLTFAETQSNEELTDVTAIKGKTFVITGRLSRKRDDIKAEIESLGGKVTGSVSSKTDYLICNDKNSTTGKSGDAKRLDILVITEEEYLALKG